MKKTLKLLMPLAFILGIVACQNKNEKQIQYKPEWASLQQHQTPQWL